MGIGPGPCTDNAEAVAIRPFLKKTTNEEMAGRTGKDKEKEWWRGP